MNEEEINYTEEISSGDFEQTPEFYWNLGNLPSAQRLREMDVKVRVPFITEFLRGKVDNSALAVPLKHQYNNPPLCLGLLRKTTGECTTLYPDGRLFYADEKYIHFNTLTGEINPGDEYHVKVYNVDL